MELAQEFSGAIRDRYAAVAGAVAIVNVDVAVLAVDVNIRGSEELGVIRIEGFTLGGAVGRVDHTTSSNLQQQLAAVVRIFTHDARFIADDPHVVVGIEAAGVKRIN